jgi:trans-aconitate methyltransferase
MPPQDAWADKNFADQWDGRNHFRDNPDRGEQLDLLVTLLADECGESSRIIDLGSGSGRVEELIFDRIPGVHVVGIDSSPSMMDIAKASGRWASSMRWTSPAAPTRSPSVSRRFTRFPIQKREK